MRTTAATGENAPKAVGVERGAKQLVNLVLEDARGLVAAQVCARDAVVAPQAVGTQRDLRTRQEIVYRHRLGEVCLDVCQPLAKILQHRILQGRLHTSASFLAEISVRSPRKTFIFNI